MSTINPIDPFTSSGNSIPVSMNSLMGMGNFSSVFSQAETQAKTPADQAKLDFIQTEYNNLNSLLSMGSDASPLSIGSSMLGDLFNSGATSVPSWETDLANLLGPNSVAQQALNVNQQASLAAQSLLNQDLGSLGNSDSSLI